MPDTVFFQFTNGVIVIIAPDQIGVAGRITPFVTDHRQPEGGGYFCNRAVQGRGEGMGGIDQQPDVFLPAACFHRCRIHAAGQADAMRTLYFLERAFGRIIIRRTSFVCDADAGPSLRCSSQYQYHSLF